MSAYLRCFLLNLVLCVIALGSGDRIAGEVVDASGAKIQGAVMKLIDSASNAAKTITTVQDGRFEFSALPAGRYRLSAEKPGFSV